MVENITSSDKSSKSGFSDFTKKQNVNYPKAQSDALSRDEFTPINQGKKDKNKVGNLQVISLVVGIMASSAFVLYFMKGLSPFGKNKQLLKDIQKADLPYHFRKKLLIEYDKFKKSIMDIDGTQNYIKNILRLNWGKPERKLVDIEKAKKILDEDHIGLDKVKEDVIAFLKVQNYNLRNGLEHDGPLILCLDGPPGVGKTSIAESIAKAMDLPFQRISLAGISHKSFIKGAQRLYKGAEPGQIIKAVQDSGVPNPVVLLDEIDKMGSSFEHGDPAFALLDVLEPKQCKNFTDENIELPYNLSNATFIITSNDLHRIPDVLKDRLSVIHIPPYSKDEKISISKFNIQKLLAKAKITDSQVEFAQDGINEIVNQTNDQGARRTIENIKGVFTNIKQTLETEGNKKKIIVNKAFVIESLKNRKEDPLTDKLNNVASQDLPIEKIVEAIIKSLKQ